ncbi:MAG: aminoglycoside phosphotransferase family protein [Pleurocapsa sp.]
MMENCTGKNLTPNSLVAIAQQFKTQGKIVEISEHGSGNINQTFLVTLDNRSESNFILQRLNTKVFTQPELVMSNIELVCDRVNQKLQSDDSCDRDWQMPRVLKTADNNNYFIDNEGLFWRAISYIPNSQSFDTIQHSRHGEEIGYGLGMFHNLVSDLPVDSLADTLVGFHITPNYLQHYHRVLATIPFLSSPENNYCHRFIGDRVKFASVLENAKAAGELKLRTIHGDPKINNIMLDKTTGQAIAVIDLDTVKPGLVHYDIGDCLRSGCNVLGEETPDWEQVRFEPEIAQAILRGYLTIAQQFLSDRDYHYIYDAIRLLAFELGLRFFTDYLQGNIYFKANYPEHNRDRALVQFKLTESIESQESVIRQIIRDCY